ncbi:hypothetical protein AUZ40_15745, partial [Listeria monocytogenes]|jgi:dihydroxyacetone kinase-like predicted kinase|nr:hypothetical protein [Listeria monocytogenes]
VKIKVDNMRLQHETILEHDQQEAKTAPVKRPRTPFAIIAIAAGEGLKELFTSLGASYVISGGQTMNPSTEDILVAINEVNADQVIVLPNNKNIFMAAQQAAEVSEIPVAVVETRTISQGMTAMLAFHEQSTLAENQQAMTDVLASVVSGSVTHAIRNTSIDGIEITEGDFLGMVDGKIVVSVPDRFSASMTTLEKMITEDTEIVTIIIGEEGKAKEAAKIEEAIVELHPEIEVEIHQGDQPVYPYLFSAE